MLINCKPGCSGKKITTNGSLDVEQDEVICTYCNEILPVSKFTKMSMKSQGDIVRQDKRQSFQFNCLTCKKKVKTKAENGKLVGIGCSKDCQFEVSKFTILAMNTVGANAVEEMSDEDNANLEE